jgi:hypothetical protein
VRCSAATVLCKERRKFTNPFLNWDTLIRISKRGLARERASEREDASERMGCWRVVLMNEWINESQFNIFVALYFVCEIPK